MEFDRSVVYKMSMICRDTFFWKQTIIPITAEGGDTERAA